jgi:hypothetical protein
MVAGLYVANLVSSISLDDARLARAAYFFARHIDDALDGEHGAYPNASAIPEQLPVAIDELDTSEHLVAPLGRYALKGLSQRQTEADEPANDLQRLIDSMVFDFNRANEGTLIDESGMAAYFRDAMRGTNLMLIGFGSALREDTDIPDFAFGLGVIYSARDIFEDWYRGIINVPSGVLQSSLGHIERAAELPEIEELLHQEAFLDWQASQLDSATGNLTNVLELVATFGKEDAGARVVAMLAKQAQAYVPEIEASLALS